MYMYVHKHCSTLFCLCILANASLLERKAEINACVITSVSCVHITIPLVKGIKVCHSVSNEEL